MERRLLTFIVASTAFFIVYISLRVMLGVPEPQAELGPEQKPAAAEEPGDRVVDNAEGDDAVADGDDSSADGTEEQQPPVDRPDRPEYFTLGSMAIESDYVMLVTCNSRGGAIERIELTERDENGRFKYRRVDVRSGYLGYFAGEPAPKSAGVRVNVVGPGSPASLAKAPGVVGGIKPGDVIQSVAGISVANSLDITGALTESEPGQLVEIEVLRPASPALPDDGPEGAQGGGDETAAAKAKPQVAPSRLLFTARLSEHPLDLVRLAKYGGPDQVVGNLTRLSCLMTLAQINRRTLVGGELPVEGEPNPAEMVWTGQKSEPGPTEVAEFSLRLSDAEMDTLGGQAIQLQRSYTLAPASYALGMTVRIDNLSDQPQDLAYRLEGVNGVTLEGWWYSNKISPNWGGAAARDIVYNTYADGHELISGFALLKQARREEAIAGQTIFAPDSEAAARKLRYIGVDAQYFTATYIPSAESAAMTSFRRSVAGVVADANLIRENQERAVNTSFYLESAVATVPPGQSIQDKIQLYAGPKAPEILDKYDVGQILYFGWFSWPAKFLAGLLHAIQRPIGNYCIAIILLTVLVRGAMFPLSRKAAVNAQKMQELAPELKKIADKYKDDMEGRMRAQRELQQRVGFNPLAGCLPMFLQLPIFIGLYRTLSVDIELRQAAVSPYLTWASNLAGPDMLFYWGDWLWEYLSGRGTGWLGPYFNILPVVVLLLFLTQQKLFMPPATDEQTAMTQKVMSWMTLVIGLLFFRVPAGLCVYFITSSVWGIAERVLVKRTLPQKKHFDASVLDGNAAAATAPASSVSLAERLRQQVSPSEPPAAPPNKRRRPPGTGKKKR